MPCRAVHFALTDDDVVALRRHARSRGLINHIQEDIEERLFETDWACETDKAWDAIHRCFAGGRLDLKRAEEPLGRLILGCESLHDGSDYIVRLKRPDDVRAFALAASAITRDDLRARYDALRKSSYEGEWGDVDFEYTWEWFTALAEFYERAAAAGRWVLFTVDQ